MRFKVKRIYALGVNPFLLGTISLATKRQADTEKESGDHD
jgi:hypothetical protein